LNGALTTANRRGAEKVRCLEALRARYPQLQIMAYGNAGSDLAHLALADRRALVNGSPCARRAAARLSVPCISWH
jgi:phosphoserine phosphatase